MEIQRKSWSVWVKDSEFGSSNKSEAWHRWNHRNLISECGLAEPGRLWFLKFHAACVGFGMCSAVLGTVNGLLRRYSGRPVGATQIESDSLGACG